MTPMPGEIMGYIPQRVKDAMLMVTMVAVLVLVAFQVKQNNLVDSRQHDSCQTRIALARQGNQAARERSYLTTAVRLFVAQTRKARADKRGTSYDPEFVRVIDTKIQPRLDAIHPASVPLPPTC